MASSEHVSHGSVCLDAERQISKDDVIAYVKKNSSISIIDDENIVIFGRIWDFGTLGVGFFNRMLSYIKGKHVIIYAEPTEKRPELMRNAKKAQKAGAASIHLVVGEKMIPKLPKPEFKKISLERP